MNPDLAQSTIASAEISREAFLDALHTLGIDTRDLYRIESTPTTLTTYHFRRDTRGNLRISPDNHAASTITEHTIGTKN